jgi:ADP-ribose pyrophosphatase
MPRQIVHHGRKIKVAIETSISPAGREVRRDVVIHPGAVVVLPLVDEEHVCILRNERPVVGETLWEIPAGTLEPDEPPDLAAVRELTEETGYTAANWRKLAEFYPSPGVLSERSHLYLATELTPGPMNLEECENLEPQVVAWKDAVAWALDGTIHDAKTMIAILLWDRWRGG